MWMLGLNQGPVRSNKCSPLLHHTWPQYEEFLMYHCQQASEWTRTPLPTAYHALHFLHNALRSTTQNSLMVVPRRTANLKYKHRLHFRPSESQPLGDGPRKVFFLLTWIFYFLNSLFENIKCYKVKLVQKNQMSVVELVRGLWKHTALKDPWAQLSALTQGGSQPLMLALREPMPSPGLHRHLHSEAHSPPQHKIKKTHVLSCI